jgi:hypothetical protein
VPTLVLATRGFKNIYGTIPNFFVRLSPEFDEVERQVLIALGRSLTEPNQPRGSTGGRSWRPAQGGP